MTSQTGSLESTRDSWKKTLRAVLEFIKRHRNIILLIVSILLIIVAVASVQALVRTAFADYFKCGFLIDDTLNAHDNWSLCKGVKVQVPQFSIQIPKIPAFDIAGVHIDIPGIPPFKIGPFPTPPFPVTPALNQDNRLDDWLDQVRRVVVWNFIAAFAVISLVLAFVALKIRAFIALVASPEGRGKILGNFNLWLLFFAIICGLFYFGVVIRH